MPYIIIIKYLMCCTRKEVAITIVANKIQHITHLCNWLILRNPLIRGVRLSDRYIEIFIQYQD